MRTIRCRECGKIIQSTGARCLCDDCRAALKRAAVFASRTCCICGAVFIGAPAAHYCPDCREARKKAQMRAYRERKVHGQTRPLGSIDICPICGKKYTVRSGLQKYCPDCAPAEYKRLDNAQSRAWNSENREQMQARVREHLDNRRVCTVCGKIFSSSMPRVTCSDRCAKINKIYTHAKAEATRRGAAPPSLEAIIERFDKPKGIPGVYPSRNGKRWCASVNGRYIGTFDTKDEAIDARKRAINENKRPDGDNRKP